MTIRADLPFDADEADAIDQRQPVALDDDLDQVGLPEELPLDDADPADALDQYLTVPLDDEWPTTPSR